MISSIITWLASNFSIFSRVSAVFNLILNELPDDLIGILHAGFTAAAAYLQANPTDPEGAFTAGLNAMEAAGLADGNALLTQLLQAFVTATAPAATTTAPAA